MEPFFTVFSTAGLMDMHDILKECKVEGWTPVSVIREKDRTVIPYFSLKSVAFQFCSRNFGYREVCGIVEMLPEDVARIQERWVDGKGYVLEKFAYPNKVERRGPLEVEIHEFVTKPDIYKPKPRPAQKPFRGVI